MTDTDREIGFEEAMFEDNEKSYTTALEEHDVHTLVKVLKNEPVSQAEREHLILVVEGLLFTRSAVVVSRKNT